MPIVAHNDLPTFARLRQEGQTILTPERAVHQTIRELHIGVLNMMPDAALAATERQFFRLVGESNPIAQFYMHPFTLNELPRGSQAQAHIATYYDTFEQLRTEGLDALIITGANVSHPDLSQESFWQPLNEVVDWARNTEDESARPVAEKPWVQLSLAEAHARLEAMKLLNWQMAWEMEQGQLDAANASAVKVYGTETLMDVYRLLLEVVGVAGTIQAGSPGAVLRGQLEEAWRACQINTFGGGVNEVQREIVAMLGLRMPRAPR